MSVSIKLTPEAHRTKIFSLICLLIMLIGSVGLDQVSKIHAQNELMRWSHHTDLTQYQGQRVPVYAFGDPIGAPTEFYLAFATNYVRNLGAAWGALSTLPDHVRVPFFYSVTVLAVIIIGVYMRATPSHHRFAIFALGLILSGAIGNFLDRVQHGFVIDWIDVRWNLFGWQYDFPNFNIADSAITIGVMILTFDMLVLETLRRKAGDTYGLRDE